MTLQIAQEIIAYCAKCDKDLAHTITAMENGRVSIVLCGSCKDEHPFKSPAGIKAVPKKRTRKKALPKTATQETYDWSVEMERVRDLSPTAYSMGGQYSAGEKLDHHAFGLGLIQKLISPDKMEVLFESGSKLLIRASSYPV